MRCGMLPVHKNFNGYESLNDGPFQYWHMLSLPIFGKYNDYGGLEEIEEDDNTKALERYFGIPIEAISEIICGRKDRHGSYSQLQIVLGVGKGVTDLNKESLEKYEFTIDDDGLINHHAITKVKDYLKKMSQYITPQKTDIQFFFKNGIVELHGWSSGGKVLTFSSLSSFLDEADRVLAYLKKQDFYGDSERHIFGVSKENQKKAHLLLFSKPAFFLPEVFDGLVKYESEKPTPSYRKGKPKYEDFLEEKTREFFVKVGKSKDLLANYPANKPLAEQLADKEYRDAMHFEFSLERGESIRETLFNRLKYGYPIYGEDAINKPELTKVFKYWSLMCHVMHSGNISVMPTDSYEQHGDPIEQEKIQKVIYKVAKEKAKAYKDDF
jgi:hypothetical protein